MSEVTVHPITAHVAKVIADTFAWGDVVSHTTLHELLELEKPSFIGDIDKYDVATQAWKIRIMNLICDLKQRLLEDYCIALDSVHGEGYRLVPPKEQTDLAFTDLRRDLRKSFSVCESWLRNVQFDELTDTELAHNRDAQQKVLDAQMLLSRKLLPPA